MESGKKLAAKEYRDLCPGIVGFCPHWFTDMFLTRLACLIEMGSYKLHAQQAKLNRPHSSKIPNFYR